MEDPSGWGLIQQRPAKTALHQAVLDQRIHQIRLLVKKHGANVDSRDIEGRTPLMLASMIPAGEEEILRIMRILIDEGAYISARDRQGRTALHYACILGRIRLVRRLLEHEAVHVDTPDEEGNTPLMYSAICGHPDVVESVTDTLVRFGMSCDSKNAKGYTALLLACRFGHCTSAKALLDKGLANPLLRDNEHFYNAKEWMTGSNEYKAHTVSTSASFTQPEVTSCPRLSREKLLYRQVRRPECHHGGHHMDPVFEYPVAALVPAHFHQSLAPPTDIRDPRARTALVRHIDATVNSLEYSRNSRGTSRGTTLARVVGQTSRLRLSTAKLKALDPDKPGATVPDLRALFGLYNEPSGPVAPSSLSAAGDRGGRDGMNTGQAQRHRATAGQAGSRGRPYNAVTDLGLPGISIRPGTSESKQLPCS